MPLSELIRPARVDRAGNGRFPLLSMTMHSGLVDQDTKFKKRVASDDLSGYKVVRRGQLVVGFPIDEGVLDFQLLYDAGIVSPAYGVWDLVNPDRVDRNYLKRFLRSPRSISYYKAKLRGSTARRRSLPGEVFLALEVPLPCITEQRRIVAVLDQANALRVKRRQVLMHLEALDQSVFSQMFGKIGDALWKRVQLDDLVNKIDNGTSPNCLTRPANLDEWGVLKLGAVTYGTFRASENKAYSGEIGAMSSNEVRPGDVLMTRKNTYDLVGAVALVGEVRPRLLLPDLIFRLDLDLCRIHRRYFHALMMDPAMRSTVRSLASGSSGSMPNISKARLVKLSIGLPPIELQQEFAEKVESVDALRASMQRALAGYDELFASLQYRAFRGEL